MALRYENRRGQIYHLQMGKTPTGQPKYYMGLKINGTPLDVVPEGHETTSRRGMARSSFARSSRVPSLRSSASRPPT